MDWARLAVEVRFHNTATPVAGGSNVILGSATWQDFSATAGKVVWNDNHVTVGSSGRATLRARDLSSATEATTTLAVSADRSFALDDAKTRVVYTMSTGTGSDGLWVAAVP